MTCCRGAQGSQGRTSWSGKPEVNDYISVAGFFIHYLSYIQPQSGAEAGSASGSSLRRPAQEDEAPVLVLGGYSHGSLILQHLPPVPTIIQSFVAPAVGTAAHEILLRARRLADEANAEWLEAADTREGRGHRRNKLSVTIGGEETSSEKRKSSKEMRRSMEKRHSVDLGHPFKSLHRLSRSIPVSDPTVEAARGTGAETDPDSASRYPSSSASQSPLQIPQVHYLLISPLAGPISLLAAPGLGHRFWPRHVENQDVIAKHTCLVLYGDQDIFSSAAKVRTWVERLNGQEGSQVRGVEIAGAGHFWFERGVEERLRDELRGWATEAV